MCQYANDIMCQYANDIICQYANLINVPIDDSAANWHIGTLINWHIIYSISPEKLIDSLFCILTLILAEPLE